MIDVQVASSSLAIEPRMSVCLKGTTKFSEATNDLSASEHERKLFSSSLEFGTTATVEDDSGDSSTACCNSCNTRRSPLSASSVMLTGTSFSILTTSQSQSPVEAEADSKRRQDKQRIRRSSGCGTVRFAESLHVRNHIHAGEITDNEKIAAWFRKPEYKAIYKNNTQIINTIERKDREIKRIIAKNKKKKKYNSSKVTSSIDIEEEEEEQPCGAGDVHSIFGVVGNCDEARIMNIHRDEEQGFSVRGLENETAKKRRTRDRTYLKAKYAVLSIQDDVDEHMFSMQEKHEGKLAMIASGNHNSSTKGGISKNKKIIRHFSGVMNRPMHSSEEQEQEDSETNRQKMTEDQKQKFAVYAKAQYKNMIHQIAEKYGDICEQDVRGALERGKEDERTVRAIDWIESEGDNHKYCYTSALSIHSSIFNKGLSDGSLEQLQDKRRPSTTSTVLTDDSVASLASLVANEGIQLSRIKRAKMFLWKFVWEHELCGNSYESMNY